MRWKPVYHALLAILLIVGVVHVGRHFIDYHIYRTAAEKVVAGRALELYDAPGVRMDGFYYSYAFAVLFIPFALLGRGGEYAFCLLFFAVYLKTLSFSQRRAFTLLGLSPDDGRRWGVLLALTLLTTYAINDAFMNANIGALLLVLSLYAFEWRKKRPLTAGALVGMAIAVKTYPVIVLAYFVWEKNWRVVASAAVTTLVLLIALPCLVYGVHDGMLIHSQYVYTITHFSQLWGARGWDFGGYVFQNIPATGIRYGSLVGIDASTAYRVSTALGVLAFVALFLPSFLRVPAKDIDEALATRMFFLALTAVPLIVPVSWYNMALFYAPIMGVLVTQAMLTRERVIVGALAAFAILFCLTTPDIIGRPLNRALAFYGAPFVGILSLVVTYCLMLRKSARAAA